MNRAVAPAEDILAPSLRRRLACFVYEGVVLFGVVMAAGFVFTGLERQRGTLADRHGLQAFVFVVLGLYFVWFWTHGGQTVAMKAWRLRLVDRHGLPVSRARAATRYVLSWLWFMPSLVVLYFAHAHGAAIVFGVLAVGVVAYACLARLHPAHQFLHDVACDTRLVIFDAARPARP